MPRTIELSAPSRITEEVIAAIQETGEAITLSRQQGASLIPAGDVLTIRVTSDGARAIIEQLRSRGLYGDVSFATADVASLVEVSAEERLGRESNESTWSEIAFFIRSESNLMVNYLGFMFLSGGVAAVGLWQNAPHIVVGAMLIAPAMLPLLRIPFGIVGNDRILALRGVRSSLAGYAAVLAGALLTTILLRFVDPLPLEVFRAYTWVTFWSTLSAPAVAVAVIAAAAGALAVTSRRVIPLSGVLIALDLVPATGMAGMAVVLGDLGFAAQNLGRAAVDVAIVLTVGGGVLALKRWRMHRYDRERPR